jgi:transcriptional regulator with XRE-family HTH domain
VRIKLSLIEDPGTPGTRIRAARKAAGLTLESLAAKSGIRFQQICDIELQRRGCGPSFKSAAKLCRAIPGLTMDWIAFGGKKP